MTKCDYCNGQATKKKKIVRSKNHGELVGKEFHVCNRCDNNDQDFKNWILKKEGIQL